jgi:hypothetical protein
MAMTDDDKRVAIDRIEETIARLRDFKPRSPEETLMRSLEEQRRAAERPLVCKEAPPTGIVRKVHIPEPVAADICAEEWKDWTRAYVLQEVNDLAAELHEAVGGVIGQECVAVLAQVKAAIDRRDHELGKTIAVNAGKTEGRCGVLERQLAEMQQRVDRAEKAMADARMELLNLAAEFRTILNDAAEAQRAISLALLHR